MKKQGRSGKRKGESDFPILNRRGDRKLVYLDSASTSLKPKQVVQAVVDFYEKYSANVHRGIYWESEQATEKYEAVRDVVQMDIYLPHYSHLGIAVAEIQQHTEDRESFRLIDPNYLFALKVYALAQRGHSVKGRKDFLDIISLHSAGICNLPFIATLLREHKLEKEKTEFVQFLHESTQLPELNISSHRYAKFKREILGGLSGL